MLARVSAPGPVHVYLARHGQTAYNHEGRFQGQMEVPLDDTGREQAAELAERAAAHSFAALWCSPLLRARETADIVAARIGLEPVEDARLMETDAGDWTDRSFAEINAHSPEAFAAFVAGHPAFAFPGGESFAEQELRVSAALAHVEEGLLPALVVCHGMVIRAALASRSEQPLTSFQRVPNAALVPLDPRAALGAELGGGEATLSS
jgi:broad specificity phosphatase PhoE